MNSSEYSFLFDLIQSASRTSATGPSTLTTTGPQTRQGVLHEPYVRSNRLRRRRPVGGYASLIAQVLLSAPNCRLVLRQIYQGLTTLDSLEFPLRGPNAQSWKNTVRHTLSRYPCFVNVAGTWTIDFSANVSGLCLVQHNTNAATELSGDTTGPFLVYSDKSAINYVSADVGASPPVHHYQYHHHHDSTNTVYESAVAGWA